MKKIAIKGLSETNLRICRQFYNCYPQIYMAIQNNTNFNVIHQSLPDELYNIENKDISIHQSLPDELKIVENINKKILILSSQNMPSVAPEKLITKLSFTHISELDKIENPLKRVFYEVECIAGTWSVNELQRQINSLYYERSALSENKEKLSELANAKNLTKNIQNTKKL